MPLFSEIIEALPVEENPTITKPDLMFALSIILFLSQTATAQESTATVPVRSPTAFPHHRFPH